MSAKTAAAAVTPTQPVYGVHAENVIAAIKDRHARQRAGDYTPDSRRLALVIEGGALRGVCSAGGAVALAQLGYSNVFDEIHATSAAVMNASYFLSNQPLLGVSVYFDNCTTRSFVNPWRFWKVVDVDYIFEHVAVHEKPLDLQRLVNSRGRLYVAVIDKQSGEPALLDVKASREPILRVLKASAAMPVFYNRVVKVEERPYFDGGMLIPFGLRPALDNGCTHALVLLTRPANYVAEPPSLFSRFMFNAIFARGDSTLNRIFNQAHLRSREARHLALGRGPPVSDSHIATVCAHGAENVHGIRASRAELRAAATSYGKRVFALFGGDARSWSLPEECATADRA
jgi:predicted patatin/cPLA2 family phospholipase